MKRTRIGLGVMEEGGLVLSVTSAWSFLEKNTPAPAAVLPVDARDYDRWGLNAATNRSRRL
mgnify:CR=1 FL=1